MTHHPVRAIARAAAAGRPAGVALALSLAAAGAVQAQEQPWYLGAKLGYTHDSNVFRREQGVSDNITSAGVLGGFHWRPGRQHLYIDADAQTNRYGELDQLNNTSHAVTTGLDWQTIENLSGSLRYTSRQHLGDFAVIGTPDAKNVVRAQDASASVRYGYVSALGVEAGLARREAEYTLTVERDTSADVAWVGARYGAGGQLVLGVTARVTNGETPNYRPLLPLDITVVPTFGPVEPDDSDRRDLDFNATWQPSGRSTVTGRVSLTKEEHSAPSRADFSGVTGSVMWEYAATGKTTVRSSLVRDTGDETSFLSLSQLGLTGLRFDNNRLNWIAQVEADWQATAKVLVTGGFRYIRGTLNTVTGSSFSNNTNRLRLGARWQATRAASVGCDYLRDSGSATASANVIGCSADFVLR